MDDPKFSEPVLRYAATAWNTSRHAAFRDAIDSVRNYFYQSMGNDLSIAEDLAAGLQQVALRGLYDLESGDLADKSLPYRPNWYK